LRTTIITEIVALRAEMAKSQLREPKPGAPAQSGTVPAKLY
jgi:hypothetical protein